MSLRGGWRWQREPALLSLVGSARQHFESSAMQLLSMSLGHSTLATILLNKDVALAEGALAFALLIGMQFAVTWLSVRVSWVRQTVTGEPALLMYQGAFLPSVLRITRVTEGEVVAAVRSAGFECVAEPMERYRP